MENYFNFMEEVSNTQNLNAHYTNSPKVAKPKRVVVSGPNNVPTYHLYSDAEANARLETLNNDVYEAVKRTPKKDKKKFLGIF